jgi:hypothetical protein
VACRKSAAATLAPEGTMPETEYRLVIPRGSVIAARPLAVKNPTIRTGPSDVETPGATIERLRAPKRPLWISTGRAPSAPPYARSPPEALLRTARCQRYVEGSRAEATRK